MTNHHQPVLYAGGDLNLPLRWSANLQRGGVAPLLTKRTALSHGLTVATQLAITVSVVCCFFRISAEHATDNSHNMTESVWHYIFTAIFPIAFLQLIVFIAVSGRHVRFISLSKNKLQHLPLCFTCAPPHSKHSQHTRNSFFHSSGRMWSRILSQCALCAMLLSSASPVLRTLTEAYSTDTVWTLVAMCAACHLAAYDYHFASTVSTRLDCTASLNSSFLMALLLSSRLESNLSVFLFLSTSISYFVILPRLLYVVRRLAPNVHILAVLVLLLSTYQHTHMLVSQQGAHAYGVAVVFVAFVCPLVVVRMQRMKVRVSGPWDIACPEISTDDGNGSGTEGRVTGMCLVCGENEVVIQSTSV